MADVAGLIAYAQARGKTIADDADTAAALQRAKDYVTHHYIRRFAKGYDETSDYVDDAIYEAAIVERNKPDFFSNTFTPSERKVLTQVDGIRWTVVDPKGKAYPVSTRVEAILSPYLDFQVGAFIV